jgi:malonyl CoA-acyl carrier protein transacylase/NADP-dependent 3-hydroxy acid dehydrogenase YdfG
VIRGIGASSDGRAKSIYAPLAAGQALALRRAYERAGYGADTVELIEAHGTATKAGDLAEFEALRTVFEEAGARPRGCALGSVKAQIGHTKAAAGSAGLIKAVMALHHKVLPQTSKVRMPSKTLNVDESPFYINSETRPWVRGKDHPRRASVSSLGFGGTNFHVAVEEYVGPAPRPTRLRTLPSELVLLHAPDTASLAAACRDAAAGCREDGAFVHLAQHSQLAFEAAAPARLAIVAESEADAAEKLSMAAAAIEKSGEASFSMPGGLDFATRAPLGSGSVAFLFPGQGSQYVGMGRGLAIHFEEARSVWDHDANDVKAGERISERVFPPPAFSDEERREQQLRLTATEWAQPAIAATSLAVLGVLARLGLSAAYVGGHSVGEVAALAAAGVLGAADTIAVARRRGELMAEVGGAPGAMAAVVADRARVEACLATRGSRVVIANHNAPDQVVLSGSLEAINELEQHLQGENLRTQRLNVSTAFHSPLVSKSCAPFRAFLAGTAICRARVPVFCNATAAAYPIEADAVRNQLADAIARPVRFVEQIEAMYAAGARIFVEVGPDSVLTRLVGRCLDGRPHLALATDQRGKDGITTLWKALGRLSVAGIPLELASLWEGQALPEDPATRVALKMSVALSGANHAKPYPPVSGELAPTKPESPPEVPAAVVAPPVVAPPVLDPAVFAPPVATLLTTDSTSWVHAIQQLHAPAIAAQMEFQRLMTESHVAFLRAVEAGYASLGVTSAAPAPALEAPAPVPSWSSPVTPPPPIPQASLMRPAPAPVSPVAHSPSPSLDIVGLVLAVVAEKTGYPPEMVEMSMDLEADLGIDSIKRVEILSGVRDRAPDLPELDTARMATLRTLGEVVDLLGQTRMSSPSDPRDAQGAARPAPDAVAAPGRFAVPTSAAGLETPPLLRRESESLDMVGLVLAVVAEKTGYPPEMVEMSMDLEADLGIDSIKRVEILSGVRDRAPDLPELDTARMSTLRTLGEVVDLLGQNRMSSPSDPRDARGAARPAPDAVAAPGRFTVRAVPTSAAGLETPALLGREPVVVTSTGTALATAVVERLRALGVAAVAVESIPPDPGAVIFLGGLRDVRTIEDAVKVNREAFAAARTVAGHFASKGGAFVTVQDTGGDFGLAGAGGVRAWLGGLSALAKTAAEEWPLASVRAIDLERGGRNDGALADALVVELLHGGVEKEVGLAKDGTRVALASVPASPPSAGRRIEPGTVFVVSGGARGVTAAALIELARASRPHFLLLGRTSLEDEPAEFRGVSGDADLKRVAFARATGSAATPQKISETVERVVAAREVRRTLEMLAAAGSEARYVTADVRDAAALVRILKGIRREWGPIRGLVHGAGVLSDALLGKKTDAQFDRVFDTKVLGLRGLLDATREDPIAWMCLFSSVAARSGNAGQADYAMANEVLNKVAAAEARRRGDACRVVSIGWGPWEGGMVTPTLQKHFESRGVKLLPVTVGARAFVAELSGRSDVDVVIGSSIDVSSSTAATPPRSTAARFYSPRDLGWPESGMAAS